MPLAPFSALVIVSTRRNVQGRRILQSNLDQDNAAPGCEDISLSHMADNCLREYLLASTVTTYR